MTPMRAFALLLSLTLSFAASATSAGDPVNYGFTRVTDACRSPQVLGFITADFGYKARHYFKRDVAIADIRNMRQIRLELRDDTRAVQREYCGATAFTTDGEKRALWYLIERGFGFAGLGPNIEFCLSGLDPWFVHGAHCASLR